MSPGIHFSIIFSLISDNACDGVHAPTIFNFLQLPLPPTEISLSPTISTFLQPSLRLTALSLSFRLKRVASPAANSALHRPRCQHLWLTATTITETGPQRRLLLPNLSPTQDLNTDLLHQSKMDPVGIQVYPLRSPFFVLPIEFSSMLTKFNTL